MSARILVVDDNASNLKLACELLACEGYEVLRADRSERALEILAGTLPDLILTDVSMPGMDGLALTRKLKADPRTHAIPIIVLTASAMKGDEVRIRAAGCDGYITKPIDTRAFVAEIAGHLRGRTS